MGLSFDKESARIQLEGELTKETVPLLTKQFSRLDATAAKSIDLQALTVLDSSGVAFLDWIAEKLRKPDIELSRVPDHFRDTISTFSGKRLKPAAKKPSPNFLEAIGNNFYQAWKAFVEGMYLTSDIAFWSFIGLFNHRGQRKGAVLQQALLIGADAVGIVGLLSFILGLILALQSAAQLRQFGANIYVADLLAVSMVREMGPMMTAILVAGRSGSAIAAEIATMKVTEEIDALKMMAIHPVRYVVIPKLHAMTFCMPLLVMLSIAAGILGGVLIGLTYLGLSVSAYMNETILILNAEDLLIGFSKSIFFAWVIVIIGSYFGFQVKGGAEGVGKVTTKAVVASIFAVIILDALFSLFYMI